MKIMKIMKQTNILLMISLKLLKPKISFIIEKLKS